MIRSNQGNEKIHGKVRTTVDTAFPLMGHALWKENIEDRVKLLESNILDGCPKITTADLHKIGLKMRE